MDGNSNNINNVMESDVNTDNGRTKYIVCGAIGGLIVVGGIVGLTVALAGDTPKGGDGE